jgi:ssDNA-binding replication factor A large subunit
MSKAKEAMNFEVVKDMLDERLTLKVMKVMGNIRSDEYGLSMIVKDGDLAKHEVREEAERLLVELEASE